MNTTAAHDQRIAIMTFASVYPLYVAKVTRKGQTVEELHTVIQWLTGFNELTLQQLIEENCSFAVFFERAKLHTSASLITGIICGYRIEDIQTPLTRKVRYLDKLVDELAKGKALSKILRTT
jgi:hypothetical protein